MKPLDLTNNQETPASAGFCPSPAKTYEGLLSQFNSLVGYVNTLERTQRVLNNTLQNTKAELTFITQILDNTMDVVVETTGNVWYKEEYYDSVEELFKTVVGVERSDD